MAVMGRGASSSASVWMEPSATMWAEPAHVHLDMLEPTVKKVRFLLILFSDCYTTSDDIFYEKSRATQTCLLCLESFWLFIFSNTNRLLNTFRDLKGWFNVHLALFTEVTGTVRSKLKVESVKFFRAVHKRTRKIPGCQIPVFWIGKTLWAHHEEKN